MGKQVWEQLCRYARETALLESTAGLLEWDERTKMPHGAGAYRAEQVSYLAGVVHRRRTDPQFGEWLAELNAEPLEADRHGDMATTVRELHRQYHRLAKVPGRLVEELARAAVLGQQEWVEARRNNDFASFRPRLQRIVELSREKADAIGYEGARYDALLDEYEPGENSANLTRLFAGLRAELVPFVAELTASTRRVPREILNRRYPVDLQESFGKQIAEAIGFDFQRGRLDVTEHPFCAGAGPSDCRITTRYDEQFFPMAFFGILHEAGHAIYEQGLRADMYGLPPGAAVSLGIHESQSRMWENFVGRSRSFWEYTFPLARAVFAESLGDVALDDFYFAVNDVRPSLIRVEADEATYNLHIIVRFELEQALINDGMPIADLPEAWNAKYREYLGIEPPDHRSGVLQDVHWSAALFGYFPTYTLGNLYAARFFECADRELNGLAGQFERGEFAGLRDWLRAKIHTRGQCYSAAELAQSISGRPLDSAALITHLKAKFRPLYAVA